MPRYQLLFALIALSGCAKQTPLPLPPPPASVKLVAPAPEIVPPEPPPLEPRQGSGSRLEPFPFTKPPSGTSPFVVPTSIAYRPLPASDLPTLKPVRPPVTPAHFDRYDWWPLALDNGGKTAVFAHGPGAQTVRGYDGPELVVWDIEKGQAVRRVRLPEFRTDRLWLSPDGTRLYAGGVSRNHDPALRIWNLRTGALERERFGTPLWNLTSDGKTLLTVDVHPGEPASNENGSFPISPPRTVVGIWSAAECKLLRSFVHADYYPNASAVAPDGSKYVCAHGCVATAFDAATGKPLWERTLADDPKRNEGFSSAYEFRFSPDGTTIAAWNTSHTPERRTIRILDAATGGMSAHPVPGKIHPPQYVLGAAFSADAKRLAIADPDGVSTVETPKAGSGLPPAAVRLGALDFEFIGPFALAPDGKAALLGGVSAKGGPFRLLDTTSHAVRDPSPNAGAKPVTPVPDLGRLHPPDYASSHSTIGLKSGRFINAEKGNNVALLKSNQNTVAQMQQREYLAMFGRGKVFSYAYTPDEQTLFTRGGSADDLGPVPDDPRIRFWDVDTGKEWTDVPGPVLGQLGFRRVVAVSPDGRGMAALHPDGGIRIWEIATAKPRLLLDRAGPEDVYRFAFTRDGKGFVSNDYQRTRRLYWDLHAVEKPAKLGGSDLAAAWADLRGDDAATAYRAIVRFALDPERAVPFLRGRAGQLETLTDATRLAARPFDKEVVIARRAVEALERCGTPDAAEALSGLAPRLPYAAPGAAAARLGAKD